LYRCPRFDFTDVDLGLEHRIERAVRLLRRDLLPDLLARAPGEPIPDPPSYRDKWRRRW
jgi:hypothetical protein